jgi:murein L,D-transpeptidase YcbB/YkuD
VLGIVLGAAALLARLQPPETAVDPLRTAVQSAARSGVSELQLPAADPHRLDLAAWYAARDNRLLWFHASGALNASGRSVRQALISSADDGLDPGDYAAGYDEPVTDDVGSPAPPLNALAARDVRLSAGLLRYAHDLRFGRAHPEVAPSASAVTIPGAVGSVLEEALSRGDIAQAVQGLVPPLPQYGALRIELRRYRALQSRRLDPDALPFSAQNPRRVTTPDTTALADFLVAVGDMPAPATRPVAPDMLDAGIRRFQARHGLAIDGVIGRETRAALLVPLSWRLRQLELALERVRWFPRPTPERIVAINIPMFQLWAWRGGDAPGSAFTTRVVVGRAATTKTPVLASSMTEVIFRPYWNIPRSILRGEILPVLRRDPAYLSREGMEIVRGETDDAPVVAATEENLQQLADGRLRLRQRPGPKNALGLVKFVFPNPHDVYVHGTPAQALFARARRDFSHGCVRVADPIGLAEWVLSSAPGWSRDGILRAMGGSRDNVHVPVTDGVRVVLFYTTAAVRPDDGAVLFAEDIYGEDAALDRAVTRLRRRTSE